MLKRSLKSRHRQAKRAMLSVMAFQVGHLHLGVMLDGVRKVIPRPEIIKGNQDFLGLTQVDDEEVLVLDLHHQILGTPDHQTQGFLIVFQTDVNTYGISTAGLPAMQEIPVDELRAVPEDYRDRDALGIASKMVEIALSENKSITLFLLDPDELLQLTMPNTPSMHQ